MLHEAHIEEPIYCVMKSPTPKECDEPNSETRESRSEKTPKDEEMSVCEKEKGKCYQLNSARSSFSEMVSIVSTSSFSAKFSDIRQSISILRQDKMGKKESFCFLWAVPVAVLVLVILVIAGVYALTTNGIRDIQKIDYDDVKKILEIIKEKVAENNAERYENEEIDESWVSDQNIFHEAIGNTKDNRRKSVSTNLHTVDDDVEIIKMVCCKSIRISSQGRTKTLYPFLLGEYKMVITDFLNPIFVKKGGRQLFLSKPVSESDIVGYSWGVSQAPEAKWGYVRSTKSSACPDMAGLWKVYDKISNRWTRDLTLTVACGPGI